MFSHLMTATAEGGSVLLAWMLTFAVVALLAALFGWSGVLPAWAGVAQVIFLVFLVPFVAVLIWRAVRQ